MRNNEKSKGHPITWEQLLLILLLPLIILVVVAIITFVSAGLIVSVGFLFEVLSFWGVFISILIIIAFVWIYFVYLPKRKGKPIRITKHKAFTMSG